MHHPMHDAESIWPGSGPGDAEGGDPRAGANLLLVSPAPVSLGVSGECRPRLHHQLVHTLRLTRRAVI